MGAARTKVAATLAIGLVVIVATLVAVLLGTPNEVIATNSVTVAQELGFFHEHTRVCQGGERLPASTTALRVSLGAIAHPGPAVAVTISHVGVLAATGHRNGGWVSSSLTLPLEPRIATPTEATVCLRRGAGGMPVEIAGNTAPSGTAATVNGRPLPGRMRIEYLTHGDRSWLSLVKRVSRRMGLVRTPSGGWIVIPLVLLMAIAAGLGAWLLMREQRYE